jgi:protein arginine kinase activator
MMCERCQNEASVHLTEKIQGKRRELHLCGRCAQDAGLALPESVPDLALETIIESLIVANVGELVGELAELACPDCGLRYMEFRSSGRLGCPQDYLVFAAGLRPLLQRYHGATRHIGKTARKRQDAPLRLRLRTQLREAINREDYEEAARLRDRLGRKDSSA